MNCDIKWHDIKQEMPGAQFDLKNQCYEHFLLRYFWKCDPGWAYYDKAFLSHGRFLLQIEYDDYEYKDKDEMHKDINISHWAFIDHPYDYD